MCFKCFGAKRNKCHFPVTSLVEKSWVNESHIRSGLLRLPVKIGGDLLLGSILFLEESH